jgi:uncharacterized protein (TIGR03067 family)
MTTLNFGFILTGLLSMGAASDNVNREGAQFTGTWSVQQLTFDGKNLTKESWLQFKIVFKGDEGRIEGSEFLQADYSRFKFKLIASVRPKQINIAMSADSQNAAMINGIYSIKGDELRICAKIFGNERPSEFESPEGESLVLIVLKRGSSMR